MRKEVRLVDGDGGDEEMYGELIYFAVSSYDDDLHVASLEEW